MSKSSKKKKKWVLPLLLVVLICVLAGAYWVLDRYNRRQAQSDSTDQVALDPIINLDTGAVNYFSYTNQDGTLEFEADDTGEWRFPANPEMPLSTSTVSSLISGFCRIIPTQTVAETQENAADYGLTDPQYTVTLKQQDGASVTLSVGMKNEYANGYYAALEGDPHIYMISSTLGDRLSKTQYDYCSATVTAFASDSAVYVARYDQGDLTYALQKYNEVQPELTWCDYFYWYLTSPDGSREPVDADTCSAILQDLSELAAGSCIDYTSDEEALASYGLNNASAIRFDLESDDGTNDVTSTYWIGNPADEGHYYFRCAESDAVFLIDKASVDDVLAYIDRNFWTKGISIISIDKVNSIDVDLDGAVYTFSMTRTEQAVESTDSTQEADDDASATETVTTYYINGKEWEEAEFKNLYTSLIMVMADRAMTREETPVEVDPYLTITFHTTLEYFPEITFQYTYFDNNFYQATVNGETKMLINRNDINTLADTLRSIEE